MLRNRLDIQLQNVCLIVRVYGWLQSLWTPWTPFAPPALEPLEYTAESRDRTGSQHDIQCSDPAAVARGQKCGAANCRVCIVPKPAVLPYASGVGGLSRRLLNPILVAFSCPQIHGGSDGWHGTFERAGAVVTGRDGTLKWFTCPIFVSVCGPLQ